MNQSLGARIDGGVYEMKKSITMAIAVCASLSACNLTTSSNNPTREGYNNNLSPHEHAFNLTSEEVRYGSLSERYEVRDGDCGGSDCTNPRYRSEISLSKKNTKARLDQDIWYGWSFFNKNILSSSTKWNLMFVLGQWKMGGDNPPIFKLVQIGAREGNWGGCDKKICNRNFSRDDVVIQLDDMKEKYSWGRKENWGLICKLFNIEDSIGTWVDIVVNTNFSTKNDGYLKVWINGEQKCDYKGQVVTLKTKRFYPGPNHRRGIYVSYTKRWDKIRPHLTKPTAIAYYDEFRSGKKREDVDITMIERRGGKALD